ncbi:MAG: LacI family DNA-binding transcriptional regulator [Gaiella sp.]
MSKPATRNPVRLRDVADAAGVNPSIASRVLNDDPTLSARPETRSRVRDAARRLGYTPNAFARGLKLQQTGTLALVLPAMSVTGSWQLAQHAERRAAHHGRVILLADLDDFARSGDAYRHIVLQRRVDGLVVSGATADDRLIGVLSDQQIPLVVFGRRSARALSVTADDDTAALLAVDHLAGLGHTRIGAIVTSRDEEAVTRAFALRNVGRGRPLQADQTEEGGFQAATALLGRRHRPTALVAAGVAQAIGAVAAIRAAGLSAPSDISLVALEDAPLASYVDPPLTTVWMPVQEMTERAVDQVVELIAGAEARDVVVATRPELIVRQSTSAPPP